MKTLALLALAAMFLSAVPARADDLSYDDPGMHFAAPAGWERVPIPADAQGQEGVPAAVFTLKSGGRIKRAVTILIADFDGDLNGFVSDHTQQIRQASGTGIADPGPNPSSNNQVGPDRTSSSSTYIDKRTSTQTANGMPAVELIWTLTPASGTQVKTYEYLMIDGQRSIDVKYSGEVGDVGDADAAATFATLYVVAYPKVRRTP